MHPQWIGIKKSRSLLMDNGRSEKDLHGCLSCLKGRLNGVLLKRSSNALRRQREGDGYGCFDPSGMVASFSDLALSSCSEVTVAPLRLAPLRSAPLKSASLRSASFNLV